MKLYKLSQEYRRGYDTYDSRVVAAESEELAQLTLPEYAHFEEWGSWADRPDNVKVEYLGEAAEGTPPGVILASFNAG